MSSIPDSHADILKQVTVAHVATIGPDGEPQNNPVWFEYDGETISFSQTTGRQKYRNLKRSPKLALSIVDPSNPYRYIEVRGTVVGIDDDPDLAFINRQAKRYLNEDVYPWHQPTDHRVVVRVKPDHTSQMG
ncbi:MAG: PPOX class F420-dependent oxidoreductase [Acidimicrobiales bacterium]